MRLIDGDALKEAFYQKMKELLKSTDTSQISNEALSLLCGSSLITEASTIEQINALPTIEERKKGKWIVTSEFEDCRYVKCNQCKVAQVFYYNKPLTNFCPNCGADMRGEEHGET